MMQLVKKRVLQWWPALALMIGIIYAAIGTPFVSIGLGLITAMFGIRGCYEDEHGCPGPGTDAGSGILVISWTFVMGIALAITGLIRWGQS